ncbi:hypothetical protein [uncultured Enterococcus sp.]|uniref:hypothetical protein n=1 Tax=uncultured Enterococcus sp. TaxID=167972 RepID=UPI002AA7DD1D|nr:hypothetical protein [uncultured Enterococcus sp.]
MTSHKVHVNISSRVFRNLQTGIDCLKYIQENTRYNGMDLTDEEVKDIHAKLLMGTTALLDYGEQFGERMTPKND